MKRVALADLVARLEQLPPTRIDTPTVQAILADGALDEATVRPFIHTRDDKYARWSVHRSAKFDILVLTWKPGQGTPIHNHAGNLGWIRLVRGRIQEEQFTLVPSTSATGLAIAPDVAAPRRGIEVVAAGVGAVEQIGAVSTVDKQRAIHRISNPLAHARDEVAVTLHVYSKPHDVCLVFDQEARTCSRREMVFDNATAV